MLFSFLYSILKNTINQNKMRYFTFLFLIFSQSLFSQTIQIFDPLDSKKNMNLFMEIGIDEYGNKWLATMNSGLIKYNGKEFEFYNESNSEIKGNSTGPIYVDSKGNIWISYFNREKLLYGFVKYDGRTWTKNFNGINLNSTSKMIEDSKGNIYFAQKRKLIIFDGKNWSNINYPKGNYPTRSLAVDSNGTIAIGHHYGLLIKKKNVWQSYKLDKSEVYSIPSALCFDQNGNLFIGYYGNGDIGFSILDTNGHWQHFSTFNSDLPSNSIRDIKMDELGNLWMCSDDGLVKYTNGEIISYNLRKDYDENFLYYLAIEDNTIWITSCFGLIKFNE
ncbi:MAG: hypothetical protein H6Q25_140 [Bacteroidetes bacterium]|nr:hypothetical protein [Bacteroidota bacterium]